LKSLLGFWLVFASPVWLILLLTIVFEIMVLVNIRDGLVLGTLMFLRPLSSVLNWQAALSIP